MSAGYTTDKYESDRKCNEERDVLLCTRTANFEALCMYNQIELE